MKQPAIVIHTVFDWVIKRKYSKSVFSIVLILVLLLNCALQKKKESQANDRHVPSSVLDECVLLLQYIYAVSFLWLVTNYVLFIPFIYIK